MDREYLEDYEQREKAEYAKLLKNIEEGKFSFEKDRYPPDERFTKIQRPRALAASPLDTIWAQIPFCGSLILVLSPVSKHLFEEIYFKVSEIDEIIVFIKETGRLQVGINKLPTEYEKLDYLEPIFTEVKPPVISALPYFFYGSEKEFQKAEDRFNTLARVKYLEFTRRQAQAWDSSAFSLAYDMDLTTYLLLKLGRYAIIEDIENLIVDDPMRAFVLLGICQMFIVNPFINITYDTYNFRLDEIARSRTLPLVYQPQEITFPCEIGKFLMKKLTYAPMGLDACKQLMYHYDAYDLRNVQESLNKSIVTNHPDIVNKNVDELSEILDNVWDDKRIPRRVTGLKIGIPLSMAAIGSVAAGPIGTMGGFLAGLGYSVVDKSINLGTEGLSERLAKLKTKSYQANVYDFKEKYKHNIPKPSKESQTDT